MKYDILFLDADETLFDFRKAERQALKQVLEAHSFPSGEDVLEIYREINEALWRALERGETTKDRLQVKRFEDLFKKLGVEGDAAAIGGEEYPDELAKGNFLLPGAKEVCQKLSRTHRLYLTTNGITRVQKQRLAESEIRPFIQDIFVSEEAGAAKPQEEYFTYVFEKIGVKDRSRALIVGDSLLSDITGGKNAGIDSCWYNPNHQKISGEILPTYEIHQLEELIPLVR